MSPRQSSRVGEGNMQIHHCGRFFRFSSDARQWHMTHMLCCRVCLGRLHLARCEVHRKVLCGLSILMPKYEFHMRF